MDLLPALFLIIICGTVALLTVFGNILVMLAFVKERKLRRWNNYFLINLAVADTLVGAISLPFYTIYLLEGQWRFGPVICDLWLTLDYTMCTSSCLSILVICIDRYWSLAYPISYRQYMSTGVVMSLIIPTWIVPFLLYGIGIFGVHQFGTRDVEENQCYVHYYDEPVFTSVTTVINYWAIIAAILILYYKIYKITKFFWRKKKRNLPSIAAPCVASKPDTVHQVENGHKAQVAEISSDSDDSEHEKSPFKSHKSKNKTNDPINAGKNMTSHRSLEADIEDSSPRLTVVKSSPGMQIGNKSGGGVKSGSLLLEIPNMNHMCSSSCTDGDTSISPATTTSTAVTSCSTFTPVDEEGDRGRSYPPPLNRPRAKSRRRSKSNNL